MTRRHALRDDQWERIKELLPGQSSDVGVTAKDNRLFVEAVLYRYKTGILWRDLPERFGDLRVVHTIIGHVFLTRKISCQVQYLTKLRWL